MNESQNIQIERLVSLHLHYCPSPAQTAMLGIELQRRGLGVRYSNAFMSLIVRDLENWIKVAKLHAPEDWHVVPELLSKAAKFSAYPHNGLLKQALLSGYRDVKWSIESLGNILVPSDTFPLWLCFFPNCTIGLVQSFCLSDYWSWFHCMDRPVEASIDELDVGTLTCMSHVAKMRSTKSYDSTDQLYNDILLMPSTADCSSDIRKFWIDFQSTLLESIASNDASTQISMLQLEQHIELLRRHE